MLTIFLKVLVIFVMVAIGFFTYKFKILPKDSDLVLVDVVMDITCPALIIYSMAECEMDASALTDTVQVLVGTIIYFTITIPIAYYIVKALRYDPKEDIGVLNVVACGMNTGFMGFPVTKAIFGSHLFILMVMENIILNLYLFVVSPLQMRMGESKKITGKEIFQALVNPTTVGTYIGLILIFVPFDLPATLMEILTTVGDVTVPLSMFIVGIQLAKRDLKAVLTDHKLVIVCFVRLLFFPALTFLVVNWLPLTDYAKVLLVFASCFPTAVVPAAIAAKEGKNASLLSSGIAITTALSMITLPLAAFFLMGWYNI